VLGQHPAKALDIRQLGHGRGLPDPPPPHARAYSIAVAVPTATRHRLRPRRVDIGVGTAAGRRLRPASGPISPAQVDQRSVLLYRHGAV
jgi:hypothetical protein